MAGTIVVSGNILETKERTIITLIATGDATLGTVPEYSIPRSATADKFLHFLTTKPGTYGALPVPYTVDIKDADGKSVLDIGKRSTTIKQYVRGDETLKTFPPAEICRTLAVGAVGKSRQVTIDLIFVKNIPEIDASISESSESSQSYDSESSQSLSSSSNSSTSSDSSESSESDSSSSVSSESSTSSDSSDSSSSNSSESESSVSESSGSVSVSSVSSESL